MLQIHFGGGWIDEAGCVSAEVFIVENCRGFCHAQLATFGGLAGLECCFGTLDWMDNSRSLLLAGEPIGNLMALRDGALKRHKSVGIPSFLLVLVRAEHEFFC